MSSNAELAELAQTVALLYDTLYTPAPPTDKLWKEHEMIRSILVKVHSLQTADAPVEEPKERTSQQVEEFLKWCDAQKIVHDGVEVCQDSKYGGYGLRAKCDLSKETDIVRIPREAMIDTVRVRAIPSLKKTVEEDPTVNNNPNVILALFLCHERVAPSSQFREYINFLPAVNPTPLYYSLEDFQALKPSPCFDDAVIFFRVIVRQFCHFLLEVIRKVDYQQSTPEERIGLMAPPFLETPFELANFTWDLYRWAVSTVTCRINSLPSSTETDSAGNPLRTMALIPFLDLANHDNDQETANDIGYSWAGHYASIVTQHDLKAGEEVEMYYGNRSSSLSVIHNGFVPSGPVVPDVYELRLCFSKSDSLAPAKMMKLDSMERQRQLEPSHSKKYIFKTYVFGITNGEEPIPENLVLFAKLFNAKSLDDEVLNTKQADLQCADWLKTRIFLMLSMYKPREYRTPREKVNERLHSNEKDLLKKALDYCTAWSLHVKEEITSLEELEKRYKKKDKKSK